LTTGRIAGADLSWGKVNVISSEQCSRPQRSCWCRYWFFCYSSDSHCISVGQTTPRYCPFHLGDLDSHL